MSKSLNISHLRVSASGDALGRVTTAERLRRAMSRQMIPPILLPREFQSKGVQLTKARRRKFRD